MKQEEDKSGKILVKMWEGYSMTTHQRDILRIVGFSDQDQLLRPQLEPQIKIQAPKLLTEVKQEAQQLQYIILPSQNQPFVNEEPLIKQEDVQKLNFIAKIMDYQIRIFSKTHRNGKDYYRNRFIVIPRYPFGKKIHTDMIKIAHNFDATLSRVINMFLTEMPTDSLQEIQSKKSTKELISQLEERIRDESKVFKVDPIPIYLKDEIEYAQQPLIDFFKRNKMIVRKGKKQKLVKIQQQQFMKREEKQMVDEE